ncbi:fumble-domain-containing protein [Dipodascopsis tothii]|uniref:fumble-domain-containing protein n=1 Tax=Dipodascopsis tothii TaxID=44089 RepID=UPI0034CDACFF
MTTVGPDSQPHVHSRDQLRGQHVRTRAAHGRAQQQARGGEHEHERAKTVTSVASDTVAGAGAGGSGRDAGDRGQIPYPGAIRINVAGAFIVEEESGPGRPGGLTGTHNRDIMLPHHSAEVSHIAVDIGGSLAKIVYFTRDGDGRGGRLNFTMFETENIGELLGFMGELLSHKRAALSGSDPLYIMATGGGAYKFYDRMRAELDVEICREDEMECLIIGLDFFISEIPAEVFTYSELPNEAFTHGDAHPMAFVEPKTNIYPYLLVNIGSGVSMIMVSGPQQFKRIGGSSLGGGTLWGLLSLLTGAKSFDQMLDMAANGDNTNVDMLVGDIYGQGYGRIGLKSTTIASSFGKVFKQRIESKDGFEVVSTTEHGSEPVVSDSVAGGDEAPPAPGLDGRVARFRAEDISRSLLYAVSNNIGQIAYLQAQRYGLEHIYFGGSFIRGHPQTMNTLSYAIKFWSGGDKKAYFLRHEGYLGSVGAFLRRQPQGWGRRSSFDDAGPARAAAAAAVADGA